MDAGAAGKQQEQNHRLDQVPKHARIILVAQTPGQMFEPLRVIPNDMLRGAMVAVPGLKVCECISAFGITRAFGIARA